MGRGSPGKIPFLSSILKAMNTPINNPASEAIKNMMFDLVQTRLASRE